MMKSLFFLLLIYSTSLACKKAKDDGADLIDPSMHLKKVDSTLLSNYIRDRITYFENNPKIIDKLNIYAPYKGHQYKIYIDDIVYSPDSLKCFSYIIMEDHYYVNAFKGFIIIGAKSSTTANWRLQGQTKYRVSDPLYKTAKKYLREAYTISMRNWNDGHFQFKYGSADAEFWTGSLYFLKVKDDLYYFECEYDSSGNLAPITQ